MRDFLDAILEFIDSESMTDEEFDVIDALELTQAYSKEVYLALRTMLEARELVSDQVKRLKLYFIARGVDVSATPTIPTARSNIFIGASLYGPSTLPGSGSEIFSGPPGAPGIDGISPNVKAGIIAAGSFTGSPRKYTVSFGTPFESADYVIGLSAVDSRSWTYESKTANGFTINSNASTALTGEVSWTATLVGET